MQSNVKLFYFTCIPQHFFERSIASVQHVRDKKVEKVDANFQKANILSFMAVDDYLLVRRKTNPKL